jgi:hypothetical protein
MDIITTLQETLFRLVCCLGSPRLIGRRYDSSTCWPIRGQIDPNHPRHHGGSLEEEEKTSETHLSDPILERSAYHSNIRGENYKLSWPAKLFRESVGQRFYPFKLPRAHPRYDREE